MWALGRFDLGLGEEEVWRETPRRLLLLLERYKAGERRRDRRAGEIVAGYYNVHRNERKRPEPYTWEDIFPDHNRQPKRKTPEELLEVAVMLNAMYGGKDLRNA